MNQHLQLKQALKLGHSLESREPQQWLSAERQEFQSRIMELLESNKTKQTFLSTLTSQFKTDWGIEQLASINVALERYINQELPESEFLVDHQDHTQKSRQTTPVRILLENIRSSFNVGSIFRTCEAMGVEKLLLSGYTATPENEKTARTAMQSHQYLDWEKFSSALTAIEQSRNEGYRVFATETAEPSNPLAATQFPEKSLIIFGNERYGLSPQILKACDGVIRIPLLGIKNSLNVSNACSMVIYEYNRQHL